MRIAKIILKYSVIFAFGGIIYFLIETVFRALRHHSPPMIHTFFLGGGALIIGILLCKINIPVKRKLIFLPLIGCLVLTAYEYLFGLYFLEMHDLRIWNYTGCLLQYNGLICFQFSLCWGALMWVILGIYTLIERLLANTSFSDKRLFGKNCANCTNKD